MIEVPVFYKSYVELVDEKNYLSALKKESDKALKFYLNINKNRSEFRYAEN